MKRLKSRLDEAEETVNGIENRENKYKEANAERDKSILGMKEY